MEIRLEHGGIAFRADLSRPLDLSIPLRPGPGTVNCFHAPLAEFSPVVAGDFVGSTARGGAVNFFNVRLNPHGNGTHTECVGHIAREPYSIRESLKNFHFIARLVSIYPTRLVNGDRVIREEQIREVLAAGEVEALVVRTLPNDIHKQQMHYSGTNPPYFDAAATACMSECGVRHLLVDLPSIDREEDGGRLAAHRAFWQYPHQPRSGCTVTELIYVDNSIKDGVYLLNIQIASFELDVSPSKPVLYSLDVA